MVAANHGTPFRCPAALHPAWSGSLEAVGSLSGVAEVVSPAGSRSRMRSVAVLWVPSTASP